MGSLVVSFLFFAFLSFFFLSLFFLPSCSICICTLIPPGPFDLGECFTRLELAAERQLDEFPRSARLVSASSWRRLVVPAKSSRVAPGLVYLRTQGHMQVGLLKEV